MAHDIPSQPKKRLERMVVAQSKWATFYKDRVVSNGGYDLEYWCVDRSDSVIILTRQSDMFLLPEVQYRPGIDERTLDFPGGRVDNDEPRAAAEATVRREFGLDDAIVLDIKSLTKQALFVDSAFSNQKVYGFIADIPEYVEVDAKQYTADALLKELQCLQCRAMLLEWLCANGNS